MEEDAQGRPRLSYLLRQAQLANRQQLDAVLRQLRLDARAIHGAETSSATIAKAYSRRELAARRPLDHGRNRATRIGRQPREDGADPPASRMRGQRRVLRVGRRRQKGRANPRQMRKSGRPVRSGFLWRLCPQRRTANFREILNRRRPRKPRKDSRRRPSARWGKTSTPSGGRALADKSRCRPALPLRRARAQESMSCSWEEIMAAVVPSSHLVPARRAPRLSFLAALGGKPLAGRCGEDQARRHQGPRSSGPIYIAIERGYFAAEGIEAELTYFLRRGRSRLRLRRSRAMSISGRPA